MKLFILPFFIFFAALKTAKPQSFKNTDIKTSLNAADSFYNIQDWSRAKIIYEKFLPGISHDAFHLNRLGYTYFNLKNYESAKQYLEKSLNENPALPVKASVFSRLARINAINNNRELAFKNLDSAIAAGYSAYRELDTLNDFNNINSDERFKKAREKVYGIHFPCMVNTKAREFDFWVGDWEVYVTGTTMYAGHNRIEIISGGCALLENWENAAGSGKSINFIDPETNMWKQTWVGSYAGGIQEFTNGKYENGAMRFVFETTDPQGRKQIGRFIFYNEVPGRVRQFNETSTDNGKTWVTSYDFTYIKE